MTKGILAATLVALAARSAAAQPVSGLSTCAADGSDYEYSEALTTYTRTVVTNHCPNHAYTVLNPNYPKSEDTTYVLPRYPQYVSDSTYWADNSERGGSIGVLFNGAMLFSAYGGQSYGQVTDWESSAVYAEGDTFDECGCHGSSNTEASYHCHVPPSCLLNHLGQEDDEHSPQIGWAADGFPVYGPKGPGGIMMQACGTSTSATDVCIYDCGGYYDDSGEIDNYVYRYYVTGELYG